MLTTTLLLAVHGHDKDLYARLVATGDFQNKVISWKRAWDTSKAVLGKEKLAYLSFWDESLIFLDLTGELPPPLTRFYACTRAMTMLSNLEAEALDALIQSEPVICHVDYCLTDVSSRDIQWRACLKHEGKEIITSEIPISYFIPSVLERALI